MADANKYESQSAWKRYADGVERLKLAEFARDYVDFLSQCKTERETVAWVHANLLSAGYGEDATGEKFVFPFREKALFAVCRGKASPAEGLNLIAAHADSPRLDFKPHPFIEQAGLCQAKTHYYGGIRKYQWLARPLALHGVVVLESGQKILVNLGDHPDDPVFCIADLLPHLAQKQVTQTVKEAFEGEKLAVILGNEPLAGDEEKKEPVKEQLLSLLNERYGIREEDMITAELEVVPAGRARFVGFDQSMIGGYGQDDRICVFCAVRAFLDASKETPAKTIALMLWDREETGSEGAAGAASHLLQYCIEDLARNTGVSASACMLHTRAISADVTAALDPDYQDVHEKQNAALFGHGPSFSKYTGSGGKYDASEADAEFFAFLRGILNKAQIPWQAAELGRVDLGGGGTVALFLARYGMNVIDLGPALLSMHSPFELSSIVDLYATHAAYRVFLESAPGA